MKEDEYSPCAMTAGVSRICKVGVQMPDLPRVCICGPLTPNPFCYEHGILPKDPRDRLVPDDEFGEVHLRVYLQQTDDADGDV